MEAGCRRVEVLVFMSLVGQGVLRLFFLMVRIGRPYSLWVFGAIVRRVGWVFKVGVVCVG